MTVKRILPLAVILAAAALATRFFTPSADAAAGLPADAESAVARLNSSPRHTEWVNIKDGDDTISAWVVYPERSEKAPVVIVIHEIFGLADWVRAVADQFAAEGFIAVAPDLLSGKGPDGGDTPADPQEAIQLVRSLDEAEVNRRLDATARYGASLPAATSKYAVVGFCWGGARSFGYAVAQPNVGAAAVYYGTSPATEKLTAVQAPILGLYGEADARVNATIPDAEAELNRLGKSYEKHIFEGAGHGFLRQQSGQDGANMEAARKAWERTVDFFKEHLEN